MRGNTRIAQLIVNDGTLDSLPATVTITTQNSRPVASAGTPQTVVVGTTVTLDGSASSHSKGEGTIDRSEKLHLTVAAVVSEVMPDGNLLVSGSQEVRVNFEVRVLNVAGIVRPLDIAADNTIAYDKIAEARVSYGGRGRISEVQQPAWGQRLYDAVAPF